MVMTSASHAEGREFESRLEYFFCQFMHLHAQGTYYAPYKAARDGGQLRSVRRTQASGYSRMFVLIASLADLGRFNFVPRGDPAHGSRHAQGTYVPYREVRRASVDSRYENSPPPASSSTGARRRRIAGEEALRGRTAWPAARSSSARPRPGPRGAIFFQLAS